MLSYVNNMFCIINVTFDQLCNGIVSSDKTLQYISHAFSESVLSLKSEILPLATTFISVQYVTEQHRRVVDPLHETGS